MSVADVLYFETARSYTVDDASEETTAVAAVMKQGSQKRAPRRLSQQSDPALTTGYHDGGSISTSTRPEGSLGPR